MTLAATDRQPSTCRFATLTDRRPSFVVRKLKEFEVKRLGVKSSLIGIAAGLFLIAASLSWMSISSMSEFDTNNDEVIDHWLPSVERSKETDIPVIDLAARLGMQGAVNTSRSAIIVAKVGSSIVVDRVSDILSIRSARIQPVPDLGAPVEPPFAHGIIPLEQGMVCFLDLDHLFADLEVMPCAA
ncbi:chemotaxis protein CheW [Rhizobium anhuiense]